MMARPALYDSIMPRESDVLQELRNTSPNQTLLKGVKSSPCPTCIYFYYVIFDKGTLCSVILTKARNMWLAILNYSEDLNRKAGKEQLYYI